MISTIHTRCFPAGTTPQTPKQHAFKITLIALEVILFLAGTACYFSGQSLLLTALCFTAALLTEGNHFCYNRYLQTGKITFCEKLFQKAPLSDQKKEPVLTESERVEKSFAGSKELSRRMATPIFKSLVDNGVVSFATSSQPGIILDAAGFVPPKAEESIEYQNFWRNGAGDEIPTCSIITDWLFLSRSPQKEQEVAHFLDILYSSPITPLVVMATEYVQNISRSDSDKKIPTLVCYRYWQTEREQSKKVTEFGNFTIQYVEEDVEDFIYYRRIEIQESHENPKEILQYQFKFRPDELVFTDCGILHKYLFAALKKIEGGQPVFVHDDLAKGRAGVFVVSLLLLYLDKVAKTENVSAAVDLNALIEFMRTDPNHGRKDMVDSEQHYQTILQYAEHLRNA